MQKTLSQNRGIFIELILKYLAHHPRGGDTRGNILMGWVPSERLLPHWEEVEEALEYLVSHGLVCETVLPGGKKWYQINPAKQGKMTQWAQTLTQVS